MFLGFFRFRALGFLCCDDLILYLSLYVLDYYFGLFWIRLLAIGFWWFTALLGGGLGVSGFRLGLVV